MSHGVGYVLTERFCQDTLENYFGRQKSMGYRRDNPNLTFGYQDNTIRSKIFRPIAGNCLSETSAVKIDTKPLCRVVKQTEDLKNSKH